MLAGQNWTIAILAALLVGGLATAWFRGIQMRRDETAIGINALSALSWRKFLHMVLDALARRGYERALEQGEPSDDMDSLLRRDGRLWLLSCKHGSAYVLGAPAVNELVAELRMKSAAGGMLMTLGRITEDAHPQAARHGIELFDGSALWRELRDFLPEQQRRQIRAQAWQLARRRILLSWLLALLAGVACWLLLPVDGIRTDSTDNPGAAAQATVEAMRAPGEQANVQTTPEMIEAQRVEMVKVLSSLPDVGRVAWSSQSTLEIHLHAIDGDAFARICPLVEAYPSLASTRIQLTPPPGSDARVRFRQCRSF